VRKSQLRSVLIGLFYPAILGAVIYDVFKILLEIFGRVGFFNALLDLLQHPSLLLGIQSQVLFFVFALILLYAVDFSYSDVETDDEAVPGERYRFSQFICDMIIVVSLFITTQLLLAAIPGPTGANESSQMREVNTSATPVISWMFITKLASVIWELPGKGEWKYIPISEAITLIRKEVRNDEKHKLELVLMHYKWGSDGFLGLVYLSLGACAYFNNGNSWLDGNHFSKILILTLAVLFDVGTYYGCDKLEKKLSKCESVIVATQNECE
jgi:hypothetical protein